MSAKTLPVLTHPSFPQVFAAAIRSEVNRVCFPDQPRIQLSFCCRETVISDGSTGEFNRAFPCSRPAVIHDLATEQDYCFECWKAVGRG